MKKTGFISKFILLSIFLSVFTIHIAAQKVTLSFQNVPFEKVLNSIKKQTGLSLVFSEQLVDVNRRVSINATAIEVQDALTQLLTGTNVGFEIKNKKLYLVEKKVKEKSDAKTNQKKVTGQVTDQNGEPIIGATVLEKGTKAGTISDVNGKFSLEIPEQSTITVSYIGYTTVDIKVNSRENIKIVLDEDEKKLDEVVVVGYGVQKRVTMTSAVASVKGDVMSTNPVGNISNSIGGMVSGVITKQASGAPGADQATVLIRGTEPSLILVDGVETSTWQRINMQEVESISILKDASAVAPYGLKGANGVILITTKRGKAGKVSLNYSGEYGWQTPTNTPKFMNSYEGLLLKNKALEMDGTPELMMDASTLDKYRTGENPDAYPNTDWIKNYMNTSNTTKQNISISGGTDLARAFVSIGYYNQQSMISKDVGFDRYNLRSNIDLKPTKTTNLSLDVSLIQDERNWHGVDPTTVVQNLYLLPAYEPDVFSNGLPAQQSSGGSVYQLVHANGDNTEQNDIQNASLTLNQELSFIKGLSFKGFLNYQRQTKDLKKWSEPAISYTYNSIDNTYNKQDGWLTQSPYLNQEYKRWTNFTIQAHLNYKKQIGKHSIDALAVYERKLGETRDLTAGRSAYEIDIPELDMGSSDKANQSNGGNSYKTASDGIVTRLNYNYGQKYLLEIAGRYDRTYKYAPDKRAAIFPSASIGWRISEEPFIKDHFAIINNFKVRASYGRSGNQVGTDFDYLTRYLTSVGYIWGGTTPIQQQGLYASTEANSLLTWETVWKSDAGFDLNMWNGLLGIEFDYFYDKRNDKILAPNAVVPTEYGISLADENAGKEERWGVDLTVKNTTKINSNFRILNTAVFGFTRNKQIEIREAAGTLNNPRQRQTGLPSSQIWGYKSAGLFKDEDDIANWAYQGSNTLPGDIKYIDINGDGKIDDNDKVRIGKSSTPEIMWGYNMRLEYNRFDLSMFIQGTGNSDYYLGSADRGVRYPFDNNKPRVEHADSWTTDNPSPNARYPRLSATRREQNYVVSDFWVVNTSYIKLKSLELGYNFNPKLLKKISIQDARLYLNLYNLWTIYSNMSSDFDCENQTYNAYPQQFITSLGINITF